MFIQGSGGRVLNGHFFDRKRLFTGDIDKTLKWKYTFCQKTKDANSEKSHRVRAIFTRIQIVTKIYSKFKAHSDLYWYASGDSREEAHWEHPYGMHSKLAIEL